MDKTCGGRFGLWCEGRVWSRSVCHSPQGLLPVAEHLLPLLYREWWLQCHMLNDKLRCWQYPNPMSLSARSWWGKGRKEKRERMPLSQTKSLCSTLSWGLQVNGCTVGASSQDVDDILLQEGRPVHRSRFLLCRQQGLILTLAAGAGWAAVCYGTHMADADAAWRSLWEVSVEPRVLGMATFCLTDSVPTALCQESGTGSFSLLDCQESQQRVLRT